MDFLHSAFFPCVLPEREWKFNFYQIETKYTSNLLNVKVIDLYAILPMSTVILLVKSYKTNGKVKSTSSRRVNHEE